MTHWMSRRDFAAAALFVPILPHMAHAQSAPISSRTFTGTRSLTGTGGEGGEGLRARSGMAIRDCQFINLGNGAVRVNVATDNLIIEDCQADNLYRFLEDSSSTSTNPAVLSNFAVRRVVARELDHGVSRIRYGSHHGTLEDVAAYGSAQGDAYCVGFQLDDSAHDIVYQRCEAHGFRETGTASGKYWNGDGFSDERGNRAIRYIACTATDCTDGGFDLKSTDMYLEGCTGRGNKRNYRLWSGGELHGCRSESPKWQGGTGGPAHFSFHGETGRFVIDRAVVRAPADNTAPVFLIETTTPLTLDILNADIDAAGAPLFAIKGPPPQINWSPARDQQTIRIARENA